jgi:hypothetical protein
MARAKKMLVEAAQIVSEAVTTEPTITLAASNENPVAADTMPATVTETVSLPPVAGIVVPEHVIRDFDADIETALDQFGEKADVLHDAMVDLIAHLAVSPVSAVAKCGALRMALSRSVPGLDRQQLATWIMGSTPIKIILKNANGELIVKFDSKKATSRDKDGLVVWDIPALRVTDWANAKKASVDLPKEAEIKKLQSAFAKMVSKLALEAELKGTTSDDAIADAYAAIIGDADSWIDSAIAEYRESDSWETYADGRAKARSMKMSVAGDKSKKETEEREARKAMLKAKRIEAAQAALIEASK